MDPRRRMVYIDDTTLSSTTHSIPAGLGQLSHGVGLIWFCRVLLLYFVMSYVALVTRQGRKRASRCIALGCILTTKHP